MRRRIVGYAIAIGCGLLSGPDAVLCAGEANPTSTSKIEAEAICRDKPASELIPLLANDSFHLRQCAEERLLALLREAPADQPNAVEEACYQAYQTAADPEMRMRALAVLTCYATELWSPESFLGLSVKPDSTFDENREVVSRLKISKLAKNSPAALAGLRLNDVIVSIDDTKFSGANAVKQFDGFLARRKPGRKVSLIIERNQQSMKITATLGSKPRTKKRDNNGQEVPPDPAKCLLEYLRAKSSEGTQQNTTP